MKDAWSGSGDEVYNFAPYEISSERLKQQTSNFVHGVATRSTNLTIDDQLSPKCASAEPLDAFYNFTPPEISLERLKLESSNSIASIRSTDHP